MGAILSMTGYGRAEARGPRLAVSVEARSLNHRFLEIALKLPRGLSAHETELRRRAQGRLARGRLDLGVTIRRIAGSSSAVRTDVALGAEYLRGAQFLGESLALRVDLGVADLFRLPGVVQVEDAPDDELEVAPLLKEAAEQALDELVRMRQAEGGSLVADLGVHLDALDTWATALAALLPGVVRRIQERLRARVENLLVEVPADPARLAQEVAMLAARSDVAEEIARLASHVTQFRALLATGGSVGRQLDFLAQEMHREVNTIASKADDGELTARVLEARALVERIREQVQNVE